MSIIEIIIANNIVEGVIHAEIVGRKGTLCKLSEGRVLAYLMMRPPRPSVGPVHMPHHHGLQRASPPPPVDKGVDSADYGAFEDCK
jgi:hypothetical protein